MGKLGAHYTCTKKRRIAKKVTHREFDTLWPKEHVARGVQLKLVAHQLVRLQHCLPHKIRARSNLCVQ